MTEMIWIRTTEDQRIISKEKVREIKPPNITQQRSQTIAAHSQQLKSVYSRHPL